MEQRLCQVQEFQQTEVNHQEYMLTLKKFSTSEMHFKMTIVIPFALLAIGIIIFNNIFDDTGVRTLREKNPIEHH